MASAPALECGPSGLISPQQKKNKDAGAHETSRAPRARSRPLRRFTKPWSQILKVKTTSYISLSKSMSLRDELVENERAASDPLVRVIFPRVDAKCSHFRVFCPVIALARLADLRRALLAGAPS